MCESGSAAGEEDREAVEGAAASTTSRGPAPIPAFGRTSPKKGEETLPPLRLHPERLEHVARLVAAVLGDLGPDIEDVGGDVVGIDFQ